MHINIGRRCYISSAKDLAILQKNLDVHDHYPGYKISFKIYATIPNPKYKQKAMQILSHSKQNYEVIEEDLTAQKVFFKHLFDDQADVNVMADVDQFPIKHEHQLKSILEIAARVNKQKTLYANGIRDTRVVLGRHETSSNMRVAHEIFLSALTRVFKDPTHHHSVLEPYNTYGEITSGCYFINPNSRLFNEIKSTIKNHSYLLEGHTFATEYFTALYAGLHNTVTTGHVHAQENHYQEIEEEEELENVEKRITASTRLLLTTPIKQELRQSLSDEKLKNELRLHFPEQTIKTIYKAMGRAIQQI